MPITRLLKKLSHKSLRQRSQSIDSSSIPIRPDSPTRTLSEPIPPLPPPKSPRDGAFHILTLPYHVKTLEKGYVPSFPSGVGQTRVAPSADSPGWDISSSIRHLGGYVGQGEISSGLDAAWGALSGEPKVIRTTKRTHKKSEKSIVAQGLKEHATALIAGVTVTLDASGGMQAIEQGVNHFLEGSTILVNALDAVAKLHPFIGIAVMAFKVVWTLEIKRRQNDKKIIALHVEMKEMMAVLLQLKDVKDAEISHDGSTIEDRMQGLVNDAAADIEACANACDTYSKKKLVVKVLKSPVWDSRLLKFVEIFSKRRSEFKFALSIHTSLGVDAANETLSSVEKTTQEMNAKMDLMMKMFRSFMRPEEVEIARLVAQKGGHQVCEDNEEILRELSDFEHTNVLSLATGGSHPHRGRKASGKNSDFEDLKDDLRLDPDVAMENNMKIFSRKFEVQKQQLVEELSCVIEREGDRIIEAVSSGPHDKIIDPDVHKVWKEMGWRGSIKARHFVMALRDYFMEKWDTGPSPKYPVAVAVTNTDTDQWALTYLNVVRLQPLSESFDDDASGFITVAEVNTFTTSRPIGWSLPHWLAYWAIGWHQSMVAYEAKIGEIIAKMYAILPNIRPANRGSVNDYLASTYQGVRTLQASLNPCIINESLQARFKTYVDAEEARLRRNLEAVKYDIDARDTLALVTGPGRIERFTLPLTYLLLERHFEIIRVCQSRVTHPDELWNASDTLKWLFDAVSERVDTLQSLFKQQTLDLDQQFSTFAHGLFRYWNDSSRLWDSATVKDTEFLEYAYNDDLEKKDVNIKDILNYPVDQQELDLAAYKPTARNETVQTGGSPLNLLLGPWNGFIYPTATAEAPCAGMISMIFHATAAQSQIQRFEASGRSNRTEFFVSGECRRTEANNIVTLKFTRRSPGRFPAQYYYGQFDTVTETLTGKWGSDPDPTAHQAIFVFKRTEPEYLCFRPAPSVFKANKARALWSFALSAVPYHVRRRSYSWTFFKQRRDNRNRFIKLYIRDTRFGRPLDDNERAEFMQLRQSLTSADSRFYHSLAEHQIRRTTCHHEYCDNCHGLIGGARIICLDCQMKDTFNTVDLCEAPDCVAARIVRDDLKRPHLPTHDLMKVRQVIHTRQFGKLDREAKQALKTARAAFQCDERHGPVADQGNNSSIRERDSPDVSVGLSCRACKSWVTQPCWYCVQCPGDTFICNQCGAGESVSFGEHDVTHALVRCQELPIHIDPSASMDDRLSRVEMLLESLLDTMRGQPIAF